jgi:hypothetical protein
MPDRVPYEGSSLEARDDDKATAEATGLVATAHQFEEGSGQPLYGAVQDEPWQNVGGADDHQGEGGEFADTGAYSEPAGFDLAQAAEYYQSLPPQMAEAWLEEIGPDARQQIIDQYSAMETQRVRGEYLQQVDNHYAYRQQREEQFAEQEAQQEARGMMLAEQIVEQAAAQHHTSVDSADVIEAAEEEFEQLTTLWLAQGYSQAQIAATLNQPEFAQSVLEDLVKGHADARELQRALGPLGRPRQSWAR